MDDRAAELADALRCRSQVADGEVGEGGGVAGTRPALVNPEPKAANLDLPSGAAVGWSRQKLDAQHAVPEAASAIGVVSGEFDQRGGHQAEYVAIQGLQPLEPLVGIRYRRS